MRKKLDYDYCSASPILEWLGDKWALVVLLKLHENEVIRFNELYKTAFIFMLVAAALFIAATIVAYALERPYFSAVFSCSGAFLAFLGIIFATCSKPKKRKRHLVTDEIAAENDDDDEISENFVDKEQ